MGTYEPEVCCNYCLKEPNCDRRYLTVKKYCNKVKLKIGEKYANKTHVERAWHTSYFDPEKVNFISNKRQETLGDVAPETLYLSPEQYEKYGLSVIQAKIAELKFTDNLKIKKIASMVNLSRGGVKYHLTQIIKKLKKENKT